MSNLILPKKSGLWLPERDILAPREGIAFHAAMSAGKRRGSRAIADIAASYTQDWSSYANTAALAAAAPWIANNAANTGQISLLSTGPTAGGKAIRYTFPDRTGDTANRCSDYGIGYGEWDLRHASVLGAAVTKIAVEQYFQFSTNFVTAAPAGWACVSGIEWKWFFLSTFNPDSSLRIGYGLEGNKIAFTDPTNGIDQSPFLFGTDYVYTDAAWHRLRVYADLTPAAGSRVYKAWLENITTGAMDLKYNKSNIGGDVGYNVWGIKYGANMNQGPAAVQTVDWGTTRIWHGSNMPSWAA